MPSVLSKERLRLRLALYTQGADGEIFDYSCKTKGCAGEMADLI